DNGSSGSGGGAVDRGVGDPRRLAVLLIAAVVALSLPARGYGYDFSESTGQMASGSTLTSNAVLTLSEVKQIVPEMCQETASGQGDESHVGGGALYGDLIVNVTLQAYDGTTENLAKVTELIRMEAAAARRAL